MYARPVPVPADGTAHVLMLCATYIVCMCGLVCIKAMQEVAKLFENAPKCVEMLSLYKWSGMQSDVTL